MELISASKEDRLLEMFAGANYSQFQPVSIVQYKGDTIRSRLGKGQKDTSFTKYLNTKFMEIMTGDPSHKWITQFVRTKH
jgi:hypothetical protein